MEICGLYFTLEPQPLGSFIHQSKISSVSPSREFFVSVSQKPPFNQALLVESKSSDKLGLLFVALELGGLQVLAIKTPSGVDEVL